MRAAIGQCGSFARRGVSLMEVLISVFVVSVGLLGLAAMFPIGTFAVIEAGKADRSGSYGRGQLRDLKIRGLLNYDRQPTVPGIDWDVTSGGNLAQALKYDGQAMEVGAFAIDPLGVLNGMGAIGPQDANDLDRLPRVTYRWITDQANDAYRREAAWEVFTCHDDIDTEEREDAGQRTRVIMDELTARPGSKGHYSWLATVLPAASERHLPMAEKSRFHVSVAVVYRRPLGNDAQGGQYTADCRFRGMGYGGATVELTNSQPNDPKLPLELKKGEWILLYARRPNAPQGVVDVCNWYRVVSAGQNDNGWIAMLNGPDWPVNPNAINDDNDEDLSKRATAVIIPGVIGVYSTTIELDRSTVWNDYRVSN